MLPVARAVSSGREKEARLRLCEATRDEHAAAEGVADQRRHPRDPYAFCDIGACERIGDRLFADAFEG